MVKINNSKSVLPVMLPIAQLLVHAWEGPMSTNIRSDTTTKGTTKDETEHTKRENTRENQYEYRCNHQQRYQLNWYPPNNGIMIVAANTENQKKDHG